MREKNIVGEKEGERTERKRQKEREREKKKEYGTIERKISLKSDFLDQSIVMKKPIGLGKRRKTEIYFTNENSFIV